MFLERYALHDNPFARATERPLVESVSAREVTAKLRSAAAGRVHCLAISGPEGSGKTLAVQRNLHYFEGWSRIWVDCPVAGSRELLGALLTELGLGDVEGASHELRRILEVFLRHQVARGRRGLLVVDNLDAASPGVFDVLTWLGGLKLRGKPLLTLVLIARSDDLVARVLPGAAGKVGQVYQHQIFSGFTLEETTEYVRACLNQAGCNDSLALVSDDALPRHSGLLPAAFRRASTALCALALNALAESVAATGRRPRLDKNGVRHAAAMLGFEFDQGALSTREEPLSREHIHEHKQDELRIEAARLLVGSGGQLVAEVSLNRSRVVLGRDSSCDITLDSRYVSRYQNLFLQTAGGWLMIDLNSTNGSFVNGQKVREHMLEDGDIIAVGNHQLRFFGAGSRAARAETAATAVRPTLKVLPSGEDAERAAGRLKYPGASAAPGAADAGWRRRP